MPKKLQPKGAEALFVASFLYGITGVLVRLMGSMWGNDAQVAARYALAFVLLVAYGYFRKTKTRIPRGKILYVAMFAIAFALSVLFITLGIEKTTIANSMFTFYAANILTSFILGSLILKESVTNNKIIALVLALIGLGLYAGQLFSNNPGIIYSVLGGACGGVSNMFSKLLKGVDRNAVIRAQYGIGTVLTVAIVILSKGTIIRQVTLGGIITTVIFALVLLLAANLLLYGYQHFDVNVGIVIMSLELVFAALFGWLFYNEVPAPHELLGGLLIFAGSIFSGVSKRRRATANNHFK